MSNAYDLTLTIQIYEGQHLSMKPGFPLQRLARGPFGCCEISLFCCSIFRNLESGCRNVVVVTIANCLSCVHFDSYFDLVDSIIWCDKDYR